MVDTAVADRLEALIVARAQRLRSERSPS